MATTGTRDVLSLVRGLPPDTIRALLDELMRISEDPHCAEAQADGTPCTAADTDCARCKRFHEVLARIREGLGR